MTAPAVVPTPPESKGFTRHDWRHVRFAMRKVASDLSRRGAVARCGLPLWDAEAIIGATLDDLEVKRFPADVTVERFGRRAKYKGLRQCRNTWECPVCAEREARNAGDALRFVAEKNRAAGGGNYTITLTIRHRQSAELRHLLLGLIAAWRKVVAGNPWKRQVAAYGVVGYVRTPEITHGEENGWHPHLHVGLFTDRPLTEAELAAFGEWLSARWRRILLKQFGSIAHVPTTESGVTVGETHKDDYIAKFGLAGEIAKAIVKRSKGKSRSPWDILFALATGEGTNTDRGLWREYAQAMYRHRQLTWSKGLKQRFDVVEGVRAERVREAEADGTPAEPEVVLTITPRVYMAVVYGTSLEGDCIRACESGRSTDVIRRWFRKSVLWWYRERGLDPPRL